MTEEQRLEFLRRYEEGMRPMSAEEMARRQIEQANGMRQRGPLTSGEQAAMRNIWPDSARIDLGRYAGTYGGTTEAAPQSNLWLRFRAWLQRKRKEKT